MRNRIITIIGIVLLVSLVVYFVYFRKPATTPMVPVTTIPTGTLPSATSGGGQPTSTSSTPMIGTYQATSTNFGIVADIPAIAYSVNASNTVNFVLPSGAVIELKNNTTSTLSSAPISDLAEATPSADGGNILFRFLSGSTSHFSVYHVSDSKWTTLPEETTAASWNPALGSNRIVLFTTNTKRSSALTIVDLGSTKNKNQTILTLHTQDLKPNWVAPNQILLSEPESSFASGSVWSVDIAKKTMVPVVQDLPGLMSTWSASSPWGVILTANDRHEVGVFQIANRITSESHEVQFATLPSKCAFPDQLAGLGEKTTSTIVCAVPMDHDTFINQQMDDYLNRSTYTADAFYLINASDGSIMSIPIPAGIKMDAENLKVVNRTLFFLNRYDHKLYATRLPSDW